MDARPGRLLLAAALAAALVPATGRAGAAATASPEPPEPWRKAVYVDGYVVPGEDAVVVPTLFLDQGRLHLEGRYNYEDLHTGSLFAGFTLSYGDQETFAKLTPMLGAAFGNTRGFAPGLELEARWGRLSYWLETEYLFDLRDASASYLYGWSELSFQVAAWFWAGGSAQRLRIVHSPREVDLGPMVGFGKPGTPGWSLSFYAYGLAGSPWYLGTIAVTF